MRDLCNGPFGQHLGRGPKVREERRPARNSVVARDVCLNPRCRPIVGILPVARCVHRATRSAECAQRAPGPLLQEPFLPDADALQALQAHRSFVLRGAQGSASPTAISANRLTEDSPSPPSPGTTACIV